MNSAVQMAEESGQELHREVLESIDGIEILERHLKKQKNVKLWWD